MRVMILRCESDSTVFASRTASGPIRRIDKIPLSHYQAPRL